MSDETRIIYAQQVDSGFSYLVNVELRISSSGMPYIAFGTGMARTPEIAREVAQYILEAADVLETFQEGGQ